MTKKQAFLGLVAIALFFMTADFFINNYKEVFSRSMRESSAVSQANTTELFQVKSHIPKEFTQALPEGVSIHDTLPATTLFNRIIVSELNLSESVQTILMKDIQKFGIIYEFSGGESTYFQFHSALELVLEKDDSVFDANNLGEYSFYYNDAKRPDTVFLLALIQGRVWGFEYPRKHHEDYKKLVQTLVTEGLKE